MGRRILFALLLLCLPTPALALQGTVYRDSDQNAVRDPGEPGLAGVVVSNGRDVVTTDAEGGFRLTGGSETFVRVTCPDDHRCPHWHRRGGGDFGLLPQATPDDFFFVHVSDIHAYDQEGDFLAWSSPPIPAWMPDRLAYWLLLFRLGRVYPHLSRAQIADEFRAELSRYRSVDELSDAALIGAYGDEFQRPGSGLGRVEERIRAALGEVAALEPALVISTGDLILEGNQAPPPVVERWLRFYREATEATGVPWVNTIGNNEIAGLQNADVRHDDPRFGKYFFEETYGPTWFSFDRGRFHFVALDTHAPDPEESNPKSWLFTLMPEDEAAWLEADLALHGDRVVVALNHEPFAADPDWPFADDIEPAEGGEILTRHGVSYTLTGHVHWNGLVREGPTTHISTGALSGLRWIVPRSVHPRGYRLVYAHSGRLYSAWKEIGRPVLGFVVPEGSPTIAPASGAPGMGTREVVAVAADVRGPFAEVELTLAGEPLPLERWGRFFFRAELPEALEPEAELVLRTVGIDGSVTRTRLTAGEAVP
ncbi:MAG: metallophosphoesterase [Myxococcota bacterium]